MLLTRREVNSNPIPQDYKKIYTYAVILDGQTFATVAEFEIYIQEDDYDKIEHNSNSIYYRQRDDTLFVLTKKKLSDANDQVAVSLVIIHTASDVSQHSYQMSMSKFLDGYKLAFYRSWTRQLSKSC